MKRILPLILALVAGMAQADSNSDYRAGSDFAHQIKGQGSSSIQGFKPQESIPGYNANPDETKYYGGVTAGGDGGLKNDGTTEWATGETGKTITESFMNKPKDILSPDAPFIQAGRDVVRVMENEGVWFLQCRPKILFQLSIGQKSRNVLIISVLGYGEHRWEGGMSSVQLRRTNA